jgi:hypothetical protein
MGRLDHQHRAWAQPHDALGEAAQDHGRGAGRALADNHEHIGLEFVRHSRDALVYLVAVPLHLHARAHVDTLVRPRSFVQVHLALGAHVLDALCVGSRRQMPHID